MTMTTAGITMVCVSNFFKRNFSHISPSFWLPENIQMRLCAVLIADCMCVFVHEFLHSNRKAHKKKKKTKSPNSIFGEILCHHFRDFLFHFLHVRSLVRFVHFSPLVSVRVCRLFWLSIWKWCRFWQMQIKIYCTRRQWTPSISQKQEFHFIAYSYYHCHHPMPAEYYGCVSSSVSQCVCVAVEISGTVWGNRGHLIYFFQRNVKHLPAIEFDNLLALFYCWQKVWRPKYGEDKVTRIARSHKYGYQIND